MSRFLPGRNLLIILCLIITSCDTGNQHDIDAFICSGNDRFSGYILVARKGKVLFEKGYGQSNREWETANSATTRFRIASITKQFTAMLVMQLKQAGKLDLQATVCDYLPGYRKDTGSEITIHHLLTHTSGVPEYTDMDFDNLSRQHYQAPQQIIDLFCDKELEFTPGTAYRYSNSGYVLLGAIIEAVTQKSYEEVLREQILQVAGMNETGMDRTNEILPQRAYGYKRVNGGYENAGFIDMSCIYAAGGIYSTAGDLLLWERALYSDILLSEENKKIMFTPFLDNYAYGIAVVKNHIPQLGKDVNFMFHQGGLPGFRSMLMTLPDDETTIIILSNDQDTDIDAIFNGIFAVLYGLTDMPDEDKP